MSIDSVNLFAQGLKYGMLIGIGSGFVGWFIKLCYDTFDMVSS